MYVLNKISLTGHLRYTQNSESGATKQEYLHSVLTTFCSEKIEDTSTQKHTITIHGKVIRSPVSPFNGHHSALFSGGFLSINSSSDFGLGDTFTVEVWVKPRTLNGETVLFDIGSSDKAGFLRINSSGVPYTSVTDAKILVPKDVIVSTNAWAHIAIAADSNGVRLYVNGAKVAYSKTRAAWPTDSKRLYIGADCGGGCGFDGYMSNLRIFKGTTLYTSAFTPSETPLIPSIPI